MVKFNPDLKRMQRLQELQKQKQEKEEELSEVEKKKKEELSEVERRLEEAVAELISPKEEEITADEEREEELRREVETLEETIEQERREELEQSEAGGVEYITGAEMQSLPELYEEVKRGNEDAVQRAQSLIYTLSRDQPAMDSEAEQRLQYDRNEGGHYVSRLAALMDRRDQQSGMNLYKSGNQDTV